MVSQRPGYVPRVSAVPKLHDASEDEITGHHIVDILLCVCVQRSLYSAFYFTTRIFESRNRVCKRFTYFPPKLSHQQAERYSAFGSGELSSQLFRGPISQGPMVLQTYNNGSRNCKTKLLSGPSILSLTEAWEASTALSGRRNPDNWRKSPWLLHGEGQQRLCPTHIWSTSHWWRLAQPYPIVTAHRELQ